MNREDIIRMAREAGMHRHQHNLMSNPVQHRFSYDGYEENLEAFAALVASAEREACAEIADRLPRIYRETEEAHHRLSPEPFKPSNFGFDFAEMRQAEIITHTIRARGQA
jgi:hypothetical protein